MKIKVKSIATSVTNSFFKSEKMCPGDLQQEKLAGPKKVFVEFLKFKKHS